MFFKDSASKNSHKAFSQFLSSVDFTSASWLSLAVNQNLNSNDREASTFITQLEIHEDKCIHTLKLEITSSNGIYVEAWSAKKKKFIGKIEPNFFKPLFSEFFDEYMQSIRSKLIEMAEVQSTQAINPTDQAQGIEWIKTSLVVLKSALNTAFIDQSYSDADSTVSSSTEINQLELLLFSGIHPSTQVPTFRLRVFNLDFDCIEDKSRTLRLRIFNKGRAESFKGVESSFSGFFTNSKQEVANQFIQLLSPLANAFYSSAWKDLP